MKKNVLSINADEDKISNEKGVKRYVEQEKDKNKASRIMHKEFTHMNKVYYLTVNLFGIREE
ncbi:hypothetical protein PFLG_00127 [Plasmodium falciparum RAJ116]|uniref:Uncharacterized protein n=1 Tax=Plasmodium falciparum RAJ116 TaxID=580058 RepID=A0A0L0CRV7_PLAFA|nr:hypothetical protein PFLG_00127 [Plasmodium falciparum RAJ116]